MNCQNVQNSMADYSVGLLAPPAVAEYDAHLAACAECAAEARRFDRCVALLDHMPRREAPKDLWAGISARIELDRSISSYSTSVPIARSSRSWLGGASAALCGFACALAFLVHVSPMSSFTSGAALASEPAVVSVSVRNGVDTASPVGDAASSVAVDAASVRPLPDLSVSLARFAPDNANQSSFLSAGGALR